MVVLRTSARWVTRMVSQTVRPARNTARSRLPQQVNRRGYASQGPHHGTKKSGSDLPWAIGSACVTIPAVGYLIQPQLKKGNNDAHGLGHHHPDDKGGPVDDTEPGDLVPNLRKDASGDEDSDNDGKASEEKEEANLEEASDGTGSESDEEKQNETPDTSDDEESQNTAHVTNSGRDVEGVRFKGATSGASMEGETGDTRKHIPDAKGGNKKRIESDYGKTQGVVADGDLEKDESGRMKDKPATAKPPGDMTATQSGKQEGVSNSDTKHSTDLTNDPEKPKKGEGTPETAKSKGTIDPMRPPAENRVKPDESASNSR